MQNFETVSKRDLEYFIVRNHPFLLRLRHVVPGRDYPALVPELILLIPDAARSVQSRRKILIFIQVRRQICLIRVFKVGHEVDLHVLPLRCHGRRHQSWKAKM